MKAHTLVASRRLALVAATATAFISSGCTYSTRHAFFSPELKLGIYSLADYRNSILTNGPADRYGFEVMEGRFSRFMHSSSTTYLRIDLLKPDTGARYMLPSPEAGAHFKGWAGRAVFEDGCKGSVEVLNFSPISITLAIDLVINGPDGEEQLFKKDISFTSLAKIKAEQE